MQRQERDGDGRGRQQQDPDPAVHEGVRPRGRPQPQECEPTARTEQCGAVAAHAACNPLMPPGGDGDAGDDREQGAEQRGDPAPVDRVLQEKRRGREQRDDADREQPALAEPLLEVGGGRGLRGFGNSRERGAYDRRSRSGGALRRLLRLRQHTFATSDECQAADNVFERRHSTFELLDGLFLLVRHARAATRRDPAAVIAAVTATMMMRSGVQPSSVAGTAICRKYITKSNNPISRPSSSVSCSVRPSFASRLPVTSATAPWAAASATATTAPLNSVSMTADRPGL